MQNADQTLSGTIVFLRANVGSKSDVALPHLYRGKDEPLVPLYLKDENPFENPGLAIYDGRSVIVTGAMDRGKFIITEISKKIKEEYS